MKFTDVWVNAQMTNDYLEDLFRYTKRLSYKLFMRKHALEQRGGFF